MFVKLIQMLSVRAGESAEMDIVVNANFIAKVSKLPKDGTVQILLAVDPSYAPADAKFTVKGEFDEIVAKVIGTNQSVTVDSGRG